MRFIENPFGAIKAKTFAATSAEAGVVGGWEVGRRCQLGRFIDAGHSRRNDAERAVGASNRFTKNSKADDGPSAGREPEYSLGWMWNGPRRETRRAGLLRTSRRSKIGTRV